MRLKIDSKQLGTALSKVAAATETKSDLATFKSVKVEAFKGKLQLSAFGSTVSALVLLDKDVEVDAPFAFGVNQVLLSDIVSALPPGPLTLTQQDGNVLITTDRCRFKLATLIADHFPPPKDYNAVLWSELDLVAFLASLDKVVYCSNPRSDRPVYKAVYIDNEHFTSTEGFRVSIFPNKLGSRDIFAKRYALLTTDTVQRMKKLFTGLGAEGRIAVTDGELYLAAGGTAASFRMLAGNYPNYRSVLPKGLSKGVSVGRKELIAALKRVMIVSAEKGIKNVDLSFDQADEMSLSTESQDIGQSGEVVPCQATADPDMVIRFNGEYIVDALSAMEAETVMLELRGSLSAIVLTDGEHLNVVQPIKREA